MSASFWHLRLGLQTIVEDYVHGEGSKLVCLILYTFFTAAGGIVSVFALLKLAFGG